jgi:hypothetical protein
MAERREPSPESAFVVTKRVVTGATSGSEAASAGTHKLVASVKIASKLKLVERIESFPNHFIVILSLSSLS